MSKLRKLKLKDTPHSPLELQLMECLKESPKNRDQLVKMTGGIPRTTIYDALNDLIIRGEVEKSPVVIANRGRGRPRVIFKLVE